MSLNSFGMEENTAIAVIATVLVGSLALPVAVYARYRAKGRSQLGALAVSLGIFAAGVVAIVLLAVVVGKYWPDSDAEASPNPSPEPTLPRSPRSESASTAPKPTPEPQTPTPKAPRTTSAVDPERTPAPTRSSATPTEAAPTMTDAETPLRCSGWSYSNIDADYGHLTQKGHMKTGPYAVCGNQRVVTADTKVYYWCSVTNSYGTSWTYARITHSTWQGWISGDALDDGGSTMPCPTNAPETG